MFLWFYALLVCLYLGYGVPLVGFSSVWCLGVYDSVWLASFGFLIGDFVGLLCLIVVLMVWWYTCDCGTLWASCLLTVCLVLGCVCSLLLVFDCVLVMVLVWIDCVYLLIVLVFWFFGSVSLVWCITLDVLGFVLLVAFCVFCLVAFTLVVITGCYTI